MLLDIDHVIMTKAVKAKKTQLVAKDDVQKDHAFWVLFDVYVPS